MICTNNVTMHPPLITNTLNYDRGVRQEKDSIIKICMLWMPGPLGYMYPDSWGWPNPTHIIFPLIFNHANVWFVTHSWDPYNVENCLITRNYNGDIGKSALIIGATGAVGKQMLAQLLGSSHFTTVAEYGRRVTGQADLPTTQVPPNKLQQKTVNFEKIGDEGLGNGK